MHGLFNLQASVSQKVSLQRSFFCAFSVFLTCLFLSASGLICLVLCTAASEFCMTLKVLAQECKSLFKFYVSFVVQLLINRCLKVTGYNHIIMFEHMQM